MNRKQRRVRAKQGPAPAPPPSTNSVSGTLLGLAAGNGEDPVTVARRLLAADRPADAARLLRDAATARPDDKRTQLALGDAWCELGRFVEAAGCYERALALGEPAAERGRRHALSKLVPSWHFAMLNDAPRNAAYQAAISALVRPGDLVLEIGTGSGLLAMMAARAGAALVVSCEQAPPIAQAAREIVAANGFADRVSVVAARSTRLKVGAELPRRADILIMEVFDTALLGEGVLASLEDARERLLAPDARVLPAGATLAAQIVECPELRPVNPIGRIAGFDLSGFDRFRAPAGQSVELGREAYRPLTRPVDLLTLDFQRPVPRRGQLRRSVEIACDGTAQAIMLWFNLVLAPGIGLSTAIGGARNHWRQSVHFQAADRPARAGERFDLVLRYDAERLDLELA